MNYHNQVRQLVDQAIRRGQTGELIRHQIGIDERHDPTLVAMRVYGNRQDYDVVMLMAGTNAIWEPLPIKVIYLPTPLQLMILKKRHG